MNGSNLSLNQIVADGFCVGCGVCAGVCPRANIQMAFDAFGEYKPRPLRKCPDGCTLCVDSCPHPGNSQINQNTIGKQLFGKSSSIAHRDDTGYYLRCYEGYSPEHRTSGASGGLATWFLEQLLIRGKVDSVVCVHPTSNPDKLFEFFIAQDVEQLRTASGSAYYPVEMSTVLRKVLRGQDRYAVIGVPCYLSALSLAEQKIPKLSERVPYRIGLVCGLLPSTRYINAFFESIGIPKTEVASVRFRDKTYQPSRLKGLSISLKDGGCYRTDQRADFYWSTGLVTPTACMFCDDIFAETAHITFMDAWLPEYIDLHYGTSLALVRDTLCASIIDEAIQDGMISIRHSNIARLVQSQKGRISSKRRYLKYRIYLAQRWNIPHPIVREFPTEKLSPLEKVRVIATFLRQQKNHGRNISQLSPLVPTGMMLLDDAYLWLRKLRSRFKHGRPGLFKAAGTGSA